MLYFAYGSNLSHKQMEARCPGALFVTTARLDDYSIQFDGFASSWNGATANIISAKGSSVHGALYRLSKTHFDALDGYEGLYERRYERLLLTVTSQDGKLIQAAVYLRPSPMPIGEPTADYIDTIKAGLNDCGIDLVNFPYC